MAVNSDFLNDVERMFPGTSPGGKVRHFNRVQPDAARTNTHALSMIAYGLRSLWHSNGRKPVMYLLALAIFGGIIFMAIDSGWLWRASAPAESDFPAVANEYAPEARSAPSAAPVVVVGNSSEDAPPVVGVIAAEYDGQRFVWTNQSGAVWYADNVGTDSAPIAGAAWYRGE